jgi:putative transposase
MSGFAFRTRSVFEWGGVTHRVDRLAPNGQVILERDTDGQTIVCTRDELLAAYREGKITAKREGVIATATKHFGRPLQELPEWVLAELRRRIAYVQAIVDTGVFVFTPAFLSPVLQNVATKISDPKPPSVTTVYRWYKQYRISRQMRALIPRYDRRGSSAPRQTDRVLELAAEATEDAYKASPAATGKSIHDRLVGKINAENLRRPPDDQLVVPALRTTYRLFDRMEAYDLQVLKDGKASADRRFRIVKAGPKVEHILERIEVDHTPLDLFLVDEVTALPLGRPILTLLIDVYSRFPLGYFLSFGGTSTAVVMGALRHAVLPKEPAKDVVPNLKVEHRWPCYGRMDLLVLDNGLEFHSDDLELVAFDLGIELRYCPKHQPRFKGVIERFLKTANYYFAHQIPGTSLAKPFDRGDYNPEKFAILTMAEFKQLFEKWLLDVYAQTVHRGIGTTPWAKWHEGLARRTPELPDSLADLQRRIGLVRERCLRHDGILLDGIRYAGPELEPVIRKWGPGIKVRIVVDAHELGAIQVWPPESQDPVTVLAIDQAYASGLTRYQHDLIRASVREIGASEEDSEALADAKYQLAFSIDELMKSRKQKSRRRAAHMHGKTSEKPEARLGLPSERAKVRVAKPKPALPHLESLHPPIAPLSTFKIDLRRDI